jgi:hypothetical protein
MIARLFPRRKERGGGKQPPAFTFFSVKISLKRLKPVHTCR